eukprot:750937-Hanusia_phi.AAC.9
MPGSRGAGDGRGKENEKERIRRGRRGSYVECLEREPRRSNVKKGFFVDDLPALLLLSAKLRSPIPPPRSHPPCLPDSHPPCP